MENKKLPGTHGRSLREWLQPFSPLIHDKDFKRMMSAVDSFFRSTSQQFFPVEMKETDQEIIITARLPASRREDLDVRFYGHYVKIGTRHKELVEEKNDVTHTYRKQASYQRTERVLPLPSPIDARLATTAFENGLLVIRAPKL